MPPIQKTLILVALISSTGHAPLTRHALAEKEEKKVHVGRRGTDFAAKEQNTERLKALRKRVAEYEAALARNIPPPPPKDRLATYERQRAERIANMTDKEKILDALRSDPMNKDHLLALRNYLSTSKSKKEKASLGTAYCLGCLVTDQWAEGARMAILVRRAYPKEKPVQLLTLQPFATACGKCGGEGKVGVSCGTCKGRKKCQFYDCSGGKLRNPDLRVAGKAPNCPQCGGKDECRNCKATGSVQSRCPDCSGKGKTLRMESIEKGYLQYVREIDV